MHTDSNCTIAGSGQTGLFTSSNCDHAANDNSGCGSVANNTATPNNYGKALSDNNGGVYITEWTSAYVRVWFFPRNNIPSSVTSGSPNITQFGLPMANFQGSCNIDSHFANHSIIINTDFCGAWAGFTYSNYKECPLTTGLNGYDSCVDYVGNNPQAFLDAYWEINSLKVYQLPVNVDSSTVRTSTAPLTSSSPISASNSIINPGMGQSTSSLPLSVPYSGPLSSASSTSSSSATASATPIICPLYGNRPWTDYKGVSYTISCGSDFTAQSLNQDGQTVDSFEACIELCDGVDGCSGVSHLGGDGAGTCVLKTGTGDLVYDGHTFAAVAISGRSSGSSTTLSTTSTGSISSTPPKTATLRPTAQPSTCPEANNAVYVDENVINYNVYCSADTEIGSFNSTDIHGGGFTACFTICDVTPDCVGFTFVGASSGTCYFKNQFGGTLSAPSNFVVAFLAQGQTSGSSSLAPKTSSVVLSSVASVPSPYSSTISISTRSSVLSVGSSLVSSSLLASTTSVSSSPSSSLATSLSSSRSFASSSIRASSSRPLESLTSSSSTLQSSASLTSLTSSSVPSSASSSQWTTSSAIPQIVYYVAPPCPSTADNICNSDTPTTCSNARGANFNVGCGNSYTGTTIDSNNGINRFRIMKRVTEPSYTDCLDLCDDTDGCVGVNYKGDECTLFSQITGTISDPENIAATLLPPVPVTSTEAATSTPTASALPTSSSASASLPSMSVTSSSVTSSTSSTAIPSASSLTCPASAGQNATDSNGTNYTIACGFSVQGGDLASPFRAVSVLDCLPNCDITAGCIGVAYDTSSSLCQLKSTFGGTRVPNANFIIAVRAGATDPGISSLSGATSSSTTSVLSSSSIIASSTAPVTITTCEYRTYLQALSFLLTVFQLTLQVQLSLLSVHTLRLEFLPAAVLQLAAKAQDRALCVSLVS